MDLLFSICAIFRRALRQFTGLQDQLLYICAPYQDISRSFRQMRAIQFRLISAFMITVAFSIAFATAVGRGWCANLLHWSWSSRFDLDSIPLSPTAASLRHRSLQSIR